MVFVESFVGVSDGAYDAGFQVVESAHEIDDVAMDRRAVLGGERVEEEGVDREIPPACVLVGCGEGDVVGASFVGVGPFGAEGSDLDGRAEV